MRSWHVPLAALILAVAHPAAAQTWSTSTDDYIRDEITRALQTRDGRFLAVADTGRALALIKRNSDGTLLWQRQLMGTPTGEAGRDVVELPDGRLVAAGDIHVNEHGNDDMALVMVAPDAATVLLQRTYGGPQGDDRALGLVPAADGGWLLFGETNSWGAPRPRMFLVRVDSRGAPLWSKVLGSAGGDDVLHSGVELPTGDFLVGGGSGSVVKLDPSGGIFWSRRYGLEEVREIAATSDGNLILAGWRSVGADDAAELVKVDAAGQILWRRSYGRPGASYRFFAVAPLDDGGYLAGGEINGPGFNDLYGWLARLDAAGTIVWQRHLEDTGGEIHSVAASREGGFVVGGHRESFPRMMLARLDSTGGVSGLGCAYPATTASAIPSGDGWTAESLTVINATGLVARDADKPMIDVSSPGDQIFCQGGPDYAPSEVSPPAASDSPLVFADAHTLMWETGSPSGSSSFDLYRGDVEELRSGRGTGCLLGGLAANTATDPDVPGLGSAFHYLVGGVNGVGSGTLGHATDGSERQPAAPCR